MNRKDVTLHRLSHVDDMWLEVMMEEDETQKNGLAVIVDMEGYPWKMLRWLTPQNMRVSSRKLYVSHTMSAGFQLNRTLLLISMSVRPRKA
jgi:hypothetical protein